MLEYKLQKMSDEAEIEPLVWAQNKAIPDVIPDLGPTKQQDAYLYEHGIFLNSKYIEYKINRVGLAEEEIKMPEEGQKGPYYEKNEEKLEEVPKLKIKSTKQTEHSNPFNKKKAST